MSTIPLQHQQQFYSRTSGPQSHQIAGPEFYESQSLAGSPYSSLDGRETPLDGTNAINVALDLPPDLKQHEGSEQHTYSADSAQTLPMATQPAPPGGSSQLGMQTTEQSGEQPFYVNAKQYHRILKRRVARARLEESLKVARCRKPYLHESRHKHAMRRPRGQGGRFLTAAEIAERERQKQQEELQQQEPKDDTSLEK